MAEQVVPETPVFFPIDTTTVTRLTAPAYGYITWNDSRMPGVLPARWDLLLIGPLGVNFHIEGKDDRFIYLRRWDQPSVRSNSRVTIFRTPGGSRPGRTYTGRQATPAPPYNRCRPSRSVRP